MKLGRDGRREFTGNATALSKRLEHHGGDLILWVAAISRRALSFLPVPFALIYSNVAYPGTFTLTHGKQFELCRAYEKNLESFPNLALDTNEWPLDPALKEFRKPRWQPVDANKNLPIIKNMYLWQRDRIGSLPPDIAESKWRTDEAPYVLNLIEKNLVRLDMSRVDFDADGKTERVYRYYHPTRTLGPQIDPNSRYGYWYIYYHDNSEDPDPLFRIVSDRLYDSFLFRSRFYLITRLPLGLTIEEPKATGNSLAMSDVCIFHYEP